MKILAYILLLSFGFPVFAEEANTFKNPALGFEVTKPDSWKFTTAKQPPKELKNTAISNEEFHRLMVKYSSTPILILNRHSEPFDDLNPSLQVSVKPSGQLKGTDPKRILSFISTQFRNMLEDFTLIQEPTDTTISGITSGYMRINYSLITSDGRTLPITSELWLVPRGDYFFMIGAGTRQDERTGSHSDIEEILSSVRIQYAANTLSE